MLLLTYFAISTLDAWTIFLYSLIELSKWNPKEKWGRTALDSTSSSPGLCCANKLLIASSKPAMIEIGNVS
jgi:hypothetical protein